MAAKVSAGAIVVLVQRRVQFWLRQSRGYLFIAPAVIFLLVVMV